MFEERWLQHYSRVSIAGSGARRRTNESVWRRMFVLGYLVKNMEQPRVWISIIYTSNNHVSLQSFNWFWCGNEKQWVFVSCVVCCCYLSTLSTAVWLFFGILFGTQVHKFGRECFVPLISMRCLWCIGLRCWRLASYWPCFYPWLITRIATTNCCKEDHRCEAV